MSFLQKHPLASALITSLLFGGGLFAFDLYQSPRLEVEAISAAQVPIIDGDISDAVWRAAKPVRVLTQHGGDFGGSGESTIEVRAVHDSQNVYIALEWDDPTRSLEHMPLFKDDEGWHSLQAEDKKADAARFFDDRIAIMLAGPGVPLIGGAIHLGKKPLPGAPASMTGRGLHYTTPGKMVDLWVWHAAFGAQTDRVQDNFIGPPRSFTAAQMAGSERYLGGIGEDDPDHPIAELNFVKAQGVAPGHVVPLHLPETNEIGLDDINMEANVSAPSAQGGLWALRQSAAKPYSRVQDAQFPAGSVIPGTIVDDTAVPGPKDVVARGYWAGGHWVLELKRSLQAGENDLTFKDGIMLWFAVFDHSQSRHTYHLRPLIVEMP
jgi:hypothetical protein